MADFDDTRRRSLAARRAAEGARTDLTRAVERLKRLRLEAGALARQANPAQDNRAAARLREVEKLRDRVEADVDALRRRDALAHAAAGEALDRFAAFTDPTEAVSRMPDDVPVALFPLRLETRFRTLTRHGVPEHFLWVRVFPDDALIDAFQPEIAQAELDNVTTYWTHCWRAGGNPAGHRAAWAALVRSAGAGRARWLTEQVAPLNPADEPVVAPGDHVLVVRPPAPLPAPERAAIAVFWERVWSSLGAERDAAFADLAAALGADRAAEIEMELAPVNLRDVAVRPGPPLTPVLAFLDMPDPATLPLSQESWTRGARAPLLPERLVLMGFRGRRLVLQRTGEPIPPDLLVGPDPGAGADQQIKADGADLDIPDAMRWTVDFDDAVARGMGFAVNLSELGVEPAFDRLFVLGVRVGSDAAEAAAELSELIAHHQASRKGFSILPQGRATNNTDAASAGYTWWEDPDESFKHFFETDPDDDPGSWQRRKDGAWLAGLLGVDPAPLRASPNYYGTDQAEARAMNVALWPATLGYYMEQMMEPVFSEDAVRETRAFFNRFVIGRGTLPLVRIGRQPYGILPATVWSKMAWWTGAPYARAARDLGLPDPDWLAGLHQLIERAALLWRESVTQVGQVGRPGADPHQTLLDIVGLHPGSAEFYQRYAQSFTQHYNALGFATEPVSAPAAAAARRYVEAGLLALADFGFTIPPGAELPELLEKIFLKRPNLLKGELVQAELSDTARLETTRPDGLDYVAWLQEAARTSHDTLRRQEGFPNGVPRALLYLLLHHALDLGFIDAGLTFRREALQLSDAAFRAERREPGFLHVAEQDGGSRWESLYRAEPAVTGDPALRLGDYIPTALLTRDPYLNTQLSALDVLKAATTGALERVLVEHLDCLSYRLDAWRMGMQAVQLAHLRRESAEGFGKAGVHVGAYGWLENVRPKAGTLKPVRLKPDLAKVFESDAAPPLMQDPANFGHIHAPSLDHAVTAAILRNGHLAGATTEVPDLLAVDLTSERVRLALQVIEGIRNGQSLGALLGYRLERALHDEPGLLLDRLIYDLRGAFPLAGNRNRRTRVTGLRKITTVEARNVLDGLHFMDHLAETGQSAYPYGLVGLPPLSEFTGPGLPSAAQIGSIIDRHVAEMRSVADAVADLGVAEGVYQVVRGNYDRAAGTLDALSKGTHPPVPEVASTPRGGTTLTHRIALHLEGGILPDNAGSTRPRSRGEPALAQWLALQLPDPANVFARVTWRDEAAQADRFLTPNMADLGLAPVDLFYLLDAGGARDMPGFDDLLMDFADRHGVPAPRHDAVFALEYKPGGIAGLTLFEVAPLVRALRGLLLGARPLRPTDLSLQNEAAGSQDTGGVVRADKVHAVLADLQVTLPAVAAFVGDLDAAIGEAADPAAARDAARDNIDRWIVDYAAMIRPVAMFGLEAASLTTAIEGRRGRMTALLDAVDAVRARWEEKQAEFAGVMADYGTLPAAATDAERVALLIRAGRIVSTTVVAPLPPAITDLEARIALLHGAFDTGLGTLTALRDGAATVGATLIAVSAFLPTLETIDHTPFDLGPVRDSVLALARDLAQKAAFLRDDIGRRIAGATEALARAAAAAGDKAQAAAEEAAHALLGDAFILLPEFTLSGDQLAEFENVWAGRAGLLAHLTVGAEATPFPVDDWLHGVARVRERPRHLELAMLLGEALGAASSPALDALQFPFRPGDAWLGLRFPETPPNAPPFVLEEDKLLYSAHFGPGAAIDPSRPDRTWSGLMLDEWVEVVPADQVTTGLAFHFDRPGSEAPQAILLATPPVQRGAWQWQDLVDTLHETLDLAQLRAVEPAHLDRTVLGPLLPAVISAVTTLPITAALNFAFNNGVHLTLADAAHE